MTAGREPTLPAMNKEIFFSPGVRDVFIAELRETGVLKAALAAAGISRSAFEKHKADDEEFAQAVADALEDATDDVEIEMRRRAIDGTPEPVFYKGEIVGEIVKYSDPLLLALAKANRAKFREQSKLSLGNDPDNPLNPPDDAQTAQTIAALLELARQRKAQAEADNVV